ncbi:hypothetical protein BDV3_006739 [Batrachochytrium dendrobatidis]
MEAPDTHKTASDIVEHLLEFWNQQYFISAPKNIELRKLVMSSSNAKSLPTLSNMTDLQDRIDSSNVFDSDINSKKKDQNLDSVSGRLSQTEPFDFSTKSKQNMVSLTQLDGDGVLSNAITDDTDESIMQPSILQQDFEVEEFNQDINTEKVTNDSSAQGFSFQNAISQANAIHDEKATDSNEIDSLSLDLTKDVPNSLETSQMGEIEQEDIDYEETAEATDLHDSSTLAFSQTRQNNDSIKVGSLQSIVDLSSNQLEVDAIPDTLVASGISQNRISADLDSPDALYQTGSISLASENSKSLKNLAGNPNHTDTVKKASNNSNLVDEADGSWSYDLQPSYADKSKCVFGFCAIFCQPCRIQPIPLATCIIWLKVSLSQDKTKWMVEYRFEHNHLTHSFTIPASDPVSSFKDSNFLVMLKLQSSQIASPLHRVRELIASKKQQASDLLTRNLFNSQDSSSYGIGQCDDTVEENRKVYRATYADAQIILQRAALDAATIARISADTKVHSYKSDLNHTTNNMLIQDLANFR